MAYPNPPPLFGSIPAEFTSDFSMEESVERLRAVVKRSIFQALFEEAGVGKVTANRVSLQRVIPMVGNSFKPFFIGSFRTRGQRVVLSGRFTVLPLVKVFMAFWFGDLGLMIVVAGIPLLIAGNPNGALAFLFLLGFTALGYGMVRLGQWFARNDLAWLSALIRRALVKEEVSAIAIPIYAASPGRQPVGFLFLKIAFVFLILACLVSAATGIRSIHTGQQGLVVAYFDEDWERIWPTLMAGLGMVFLYGLQSRAWFAWRLGLVMWVVSGIVALSRGIHRAWNNPWLQPPGRWFLTIFWIIGVALVGTYWTIWWVKQKDYFQPSPGEMDGPTEEPGKR